MKAGNFQMSRCEQVTASVLRHQ